MEYHKPVLFNEVMDNIITVRDAVYVDCTLGGGGHTQGILEKSSKNSSVIAIELAICNLINYQIILLLQLLKHFTILFLFFPYNFLNFLFFILKHNFLCNFSSHFFS